MDTKNNPVQYAIYTESKYEGGSCISRSQTIFYDNKIAVAENLKTIIVDDKLYNLDYIKSSQKKDRYNYGGIRGPQEVSKMTVDFKLSNGENLCFIMLDKYNTGFILDRIDFRNKEYRFATDDN